MLIGLVAPASIAVADDDPVDVTSDPGSVIVDPNSASSKEVEAALTLPPITSEQADWLNLVQTSLESLDQFQSLAISEKRDAATIVWFGDTGALKTFIAKAPSSLTISIDQAGFLPGDLRRIAAALQGTTEYTNGSTVASANVNADASGIVVTVVPAPGQAFVRTDGGEVARMLGRPDVAITVEEGNFAIPATRLNAPYKIGGQRLVNATTQGRCTSGFGVKLNGTSNTGMMFAAHCGAVGNQIGYNQSGSSLAYYGAIQSRYPTRDGAIIAGSSYQGYVFSGPYNGAQLLRVSGLFSPVLGTEVCYSGSYSGLTCGSIVVDTPYNWDFGPSYPDLRSITGVRTQANGAYAIGNGDSGGPGVVPVMDANGNLSFRAALIISGQQGATNDCQGVPAGGGRQCSKTALGTRVSDIMALANVNLLIGP